MDVYKELSIGILAGGKSRRMGTNKAYLQCGKETFLQRLTQEFKSFEDFMISVDDTGKYHEFLPYLVEDVHLEIGPMGGLFQLIKHAKKNYVFVCGTDMPFLKKELVLYLAQYISSDYDCYVITNEERSHPLCAIYSKSILEVAEELIRKGNYRLHSLLNALETKYVPIELSCFQAEMLKNINTAEEYYRYFIPNIFCVSGKKNSGKTTLIEKLIKRFLRDGRKVRVLKHDGHDFQIDAEKTDTHRFAEAGAEMVGIFSSSKNAVIEYKRDITLEEMLVRMKGDDILIIEGMKYSSYPKIEVIREGISKEPGCDFDHLICIAADIPIVDSHHKPVFHMNDIDAIYGCITYYLSHGKG